MTKSLCTLLLAATLVCGDRMAGKMSEQQARQRMVEVQLAGRDIVDPNVLAAMREIPRHKFVPQSRRSLAYEDGPLPIGQGQTISQPYIVAYMTQVVTPNKRARALEIGTGSGYQAAVLSEVVKDVYTIEIVDELCKATQTLLKNMKYDNIHTRCGDGYAGWPEKAPFDIILITAAPPRVPEPLIEQLARGGKMIVPVGEHFQELVLIEKNSKGKVSRKKLLPVRFVPMTGKVQQGD